MSWFDTKGLASLAKNALKEAQKHIDKALDIQDTETENVNPEKKDIPPLSRQSGLFYESPIMEMITTAPKAGERMSNSSSYFFASQVKRRSSISNSNSVESASSSISHCLTSPSEVADSRFLDVLNTSASRDFTSTDSMRSLQESKIEAKLTYDEDDSVSTALTDMDVNTKKEVDNSVTKQCVQTACQSLLPFDDTLLEFQTVNSDSTHSFEEVRISDGVISSASEEKELLKTISSQSSEHNSNDENETTTSSDIEIISSPNCDSSSRSSSHKFSRNIPSTAKEIHAADVSKKESSQFRESSEISISLEDSHSDVEKLIYQIGELNEALETKELRLLEICKENTALQEKNYDLQSTLDSIQKNIKHIDSDEYTQRLSELDKKFQVIIRERDSLRLQIKTLESKIPKDDLSQILVESNAMISELRSEGEKLAKEILQQSNIIKKLRAKEKSSDSMLKKNKDQISDLTREVEHLKKTLNAKEEVERSQIETVYRMSSEKRKLEEDNLKYLDKIEDLNAKVNALEISLDTTKSELENIKRVNSNLKKVNEEIAQLKNFNGKLLADKKDLHHQITELQEKLRKSETESAAREQQYREENSSLLTRLEKSESRAESLTEEVWLATIPLTRQIESLQANLTQRTKFWEMREKQLMENSDEMKQRLETSKAFKTEYEDKFCVLQNRCIDLERKISQFMLQEEKAKIELHQVEKEFAEKEKNYQRKISQLNENIELKVTEYEKLSENFKALKIKYDEERTRLEIATTRQCVVSRDQVDDNQQHQNNSPIVSLERNSVEDALCGNIDWQADDFDCVSTGGHEAASLYGMHITLSSYGHNSTTLESLQSILKQRDGEIIQLQWELTRLKAEREVLNSEISNLTIELENAKEKLKSNEDLEDNYFELQRQYDALLQLYGEKVEKAEELELDLQDVKDMYKDQINDLLQQQNKLLP